MLQKLSRLVRVCYYSLSSSKLLKEWQEKLQEQEHLLKEVQEKLQEKEHLLEKSQEQEHLLERDYLQELQQERDYLQEQLQEHWQKQLQSRKKFQLQLQERKQILEQYKVFIEDQNIDDGKQKKSASTYALKLPVISRLLQEGQQADLIELRTSWYESHPLNLWTHFSVWLKTQKYLIVDLLYFSAVQKIKDLFQPMNKPRIYR